MALVIAVPLRHLFITGQFLAAVRRMWLAYTIWSALLCLAVPELLASLSHNTEVFDYFPEAKGIVAAAVAGWLPALIVCSAAYVLRSLWLKFRSV